MIPHEDKVDAISPTNILFCYVTFVSLGERQGCGQHVLMLNILLFTNFTINSIFSQLTVCPRRRCIALCLVAWQEHGDSDGGPDVKGLNLWEFSRNFMGRKWGY